MTALEQLQEQCAVDLPIVAAIVERLRAGVTYVELIEDKVEIRAANLAAVLEHLGGDDIKLVWTGNPLRSPLTIERLILQAAGPEADLRLEQTPEQLARMLTLSPGPESARLVIVQQPETLDPIARETLAQMEPHLATSTPRVQVLFCGTSTFHPIENPPPTQPIRTAIALREPVPELRTASRREVVPLLLLLAVTTMGSFWATPITSARLPEPLRAAATPSQPTIDIASLRREFDQFLAQQPNRVANLTPDQRNALFQEYLQHTRNFPPAQGL